MKPQKLTLRGVTRFDEEMTLDLSTLPPGLIAFVGGNGQGKTTIMECLGPVVLGLDLPSRPGNLVDKCTSRDSMIELYQTHGGHTWRHLIRIDIGTGASGAKVEAQLFRDGEPILDYPTDGRQKDYLVATAALLPDRAVFMASAYATSGDEGDFLALSVPKRRALFNTLLGNGPLQAISKRAGTARKRLDAELAVVEQGAEALAAKRVRNSELAVAMLEQDGVIHRATAIRSSGERVLRSATEAQATIQAELDGLELARTTVTNRKTALGHREADAKSEYTKATADAAEDQKLLDDSGDIQEGARLHDDLVRDRAAVVETYRAAQVAQAAQAETLAAARVRFEAAGEAVGTRSKQLEAVEACNAKLPQLRNDVADLERAEAQRALHVAEVDRLVPIAGAALAAHRTAAHRAGADLATVTAELAAASNAVELLDGVPCAGGTLSGVDCSTCQFLGEARKAEIKIVELIDREMQAQEDVLILAGLLAEAQHAGAELDVARAKVRTSDRDIATRSQARGELATAEGTAARAQELDANLSAAIDTVIACKADVTRAVAVAAQCDADVVTAVTRGAQIAEKLKLVAGAPDRFALLTAAAARIGPTRALAARALQTLDETAAELLGLVVPPEPEAARQRLADAKTKTLQAAAEHDAAAEVERAGRDKLAELQGEANALGDVAKEIATAERVRERLARWRAGFRLVEHGLGPEGVQALEIDAAGPRVSSLVTELLAACYGPRFTVTLRTVQEATARRKQREVFDVMVLDADRTGGARGVGELSKGERVLITQALRLALAMFNAERGGGDVDVLWRDECDGGLDPDNRARYPAMLRRAMELGGFTNIYLVTHHPEVWRQCEAVVHVDGGTAWVEVAS